jgi:hypothetical protein
VRGAASGPVDRTSRARSVRRLADNQKVTPGYPLSSNHPPNAGPTTITAGQTPTHAAKPRLTPGFGRYDCGHSTPPEAAAPTTHEPPHHRSPAVLTATRPDRPAHPAKREGRRRRDDPEQRARHLERRRSPFSLSQGQRVAPALRLPVGRAHVVPEAPGDAASMVRAPSFSVRASRRPVPVDGRRFGGSPSRVACTAYPSARHSTTRSVVHPRKGARRPWGPTAACASPARARMTTRRGLGGYPPAARTSPPTTRQGSAAHRPSTLTIDRARTAQSERPRRFTHLPCARHSPARPVPTARTASAAASAASAAQPSHNGHGHLSAPTAQPTEPVGHQPSARVPVGQTRVSTRHLVGEVADAGTQRCRGGELRQATSARSARHIRSPGVRPALRKAGTELTDR